LRCNNVLLCLVNNIELNKLQHLFEICKKKKFAFILCRFPTSQKFHLFIQHKEDEANTDFNFVIQPFDFNEAQIVISPTIATENLKNVDKYITFLEKSDPISALSNEHSEKYFSNEIDYNEQIELIKKEIEAKTVNKVVLSRAVRNLDPLQGKEIDVFNKLQSKNGSAFAYLLYTPSTGTWLGASPELLATYGDGQIKTVSLAGTLPAGDEDWTEKEYEEQKITTKYIKRVINSMSTRTDGPYEVNAGPIKHLKTDIIASITEEELPDLLKRLSPTAALCGNPKKAAFNILGKIEKHKRSLYGGYLGVKSKNTLEYYVNIRCMNIGEIKNTIFVGGGITADSIPEKEWAETESKSQIMLAAINGK